MPSSSVSENLIRLALVFVVSSNVLYIVVTIFAFRDEQLRGCGVSFSYFDKEAAMKTINIGVLFLWTQILHFLIVLTDDYLVTKFTSPKYEVYFSIYYKLFYLVGMAFSLALTPVWSAVTKAQEEFMLTSRNRMIPKFSPARPRALEALCHRFGHPRPC